MDAGRWWALPFSLSLAFGLPIAIGCAVWDRWAALSAWHKRWSGVRAAKAERRRVERQIMEEQIDKRLRGE